MEAGLSISESDDTTVNDFLDSRFHELVEMHKNIFIDFLEQPAMADSFTRYQIGHRHARFPDVESTAFERTDTRIC